MVQLLLFTVLTVTVIYVASETSDRCGADTEAISHCFVEKIQKSPRTNKHTLQLKSSAVAKVTLKLHDNFIRKRKPGEAILANKTDVTMTCKRGYTGDNCDTCAQGWTGKNCNICAKGWTGDNCDSCDGNFGPAPQCDQCLKGWAGENCTICAKGWTGPECDACNQNFGPPGDCGRCVTGWAGLECDSCARGWTGNNCNACAPNFGPAGECNKCLSGLTGNNCNYCEGFGFSTESNCSECIQNGYWKGTTRFEYIDVHLTFTGETCSELVPGTAMTYQTQNRTVIEGSLDEDRNQLTFKNNNGNVFVGIITSDKTIQNNWLYLRYISSSRK